MSEQDFPQRLEEDDAEEALTLDLNFISGRGEKKDVDRGEETAATEAPLIQAQAAPLAQTETAPLASYTPLVKAEEPSSIESEDSPTQAPFVAHAEGLPHTESSTPLAQAPSATHTESLPLIESSMPLAQVSSPTQMEETSGEPEALEARDSSIAIGGQTVASGSSTTRLEPRAVSVDIVGVPATLTGATLSGTVSRSSPPDAPISSPFSSMSDAPSLSPTFASSRTVSLPTAPPIFETPSSPSVLETQSVGNEGATNSSSPSASAPPNGFVEPMWAAVRDRNRQSDNESTPALAQPVLTGEQLPIGGEVGLPGGITPKDDIIGESALVITGQIEVATPGLYTTATPMVTGEIPIMARIDPIPTPRDVLVHCVEGEDGGAKSFEGLEDVEEGASLSEPLDETPVQHRSFTSPSANFGEPEPEASWRPREDIGEQAVEELGVPAAPHSLDDAIFDSASVQAEVPSRTRAHWANLFGYPLFVPLAQFLIADSGARLTLNDAGSVATGNFTPLPFLELPGGLVLILFLFLLARKSSLGPWFVGVLMTLVGSPSLIVPGLTAEFLLSYLWMLSSSSTFGQNLSHHVQVLTYSGRLLLVGLVFMGIGFLSHSVRRIDRNEELFHAKVKRINPVEAHFTARTRRRAVKATARF